MPDPQQLPHLITLLEDESVRDAVVKQLTFFSPSLEDEIESQQIRINAEQARIIRSLLPQQYREWILQSWKEWFIALDDKERLERALTLIAQFQLGRLYPSSVRKLLDDLADEYDARYAHRDVLELAEFLFQGYGLRGAEQDDYYNPLNSNIVHVIEQRRGIPISLACIYILVGKRLRLNIEGCNFPGHFLALASHKREKLIVDCFNGGTCINDESLAAVNAQISRDDILKLECSAPLIVARVLRNLLNAYQQAGDDATATTMGELLYSVERIL
jgi:regulator of sirC expression with transglutaminase-like and TPR domain